MLIAARSEELEVSQSFDRWLSSLGRRSPVRSLSLDLLAEEDIEGLLWRLGRRADSKPPPAGAALEEQGASNGAEAHGLESLVGGSLLRPTVSPSTLWRRSRPYLKRKSS